ncbi:MAG: lysylphosphatidylglycerol synthase transmembrane domain-containing protein [Candidatus Enteromonas sp.]|nr:lysylphosphatidylglycerol synthase transmembrane domain-containing protein [Candidatus Enteromonas sp.]
MAEYQMNASHNGPQKKSGAWKYVVYILVVLIATAISLAVSLWNDFDSIVSTIGNADWRYVLLVFAIVAASYMIDGVILLVFCRLYTRKYKFHQAIACSMVGQFYSNVTPGASGGQVMQVYTMKSQGILVSNAASIMVMWFILYQSALIVFGIISLAFEATTMVSINPSIGLFGITFNPPMWPLVIVGFVLNLSVILLLFVMSYNHHIHNFILHHVIGFLGKIRILKKPDETRESLRVQVENFKIELRRLQSNIPVLILLLFLFFLVLAFRFSVPYFCGLAMHAWGNEQHFVFYAFDQNVPSMLRAAFYTSFHQMVSGLIPLPGSAGVSELFYTLLFQPFFNGDFALTSATQLLWRFATFHLILFISGLVSAFYRSRGGKGVTYASRKTFVTLQLETYEERKRTSDSMYETAQFSRKEFQRKFAGGNAQKRTSKEINIPYEDEDSNTFDFHGTRMRVGDPGAKPKKKKEPKKAAKPKKGKKNHPTNNDGWDSWEF